jgi:hypothetical protein
MRASLARASATPPLPCRTPESTVAQGAARRLPSNQHPPPARDAARTTPYGLAFGLIRQCIRALVGTTNAPTLAETNRTESSCNNPPSHCTYPRQSDNDSRPPVAHRSRKMMARKRRRYRSHCLRGTAPAHIHYRRWSRLNRLRTRRRCPCHNRYPYDIDQIRKHR